ncbi:unnamed protein product [Lepeophtheirus salmonis]|uniref:(salmon louse) hypothetical protein n=1 Tax=Lepeophtheirus salmonis TaxID=72036 RepID=A0A7R8CGR2_LEPSM|nr:unnamed protein product [Lepeophtheirus salmonis]CAF2778242.1 unnamed protein product [Lepeophtheirus salmonis]
MWTVGVLIFLPEIPEDCLRILHEICLNFENEEDCIGAYSFDVVDIKKRFEIETQTQTIYGDYKKTEQLVRTCYVSVENCIARTRLEWNKIASVTTDRARALKGKNVGLLKLMNDKIKEEHPDYALIPLYCVIHQESMCKGVLNIQYVTDSIVKVVNLIRTRGLNHRQFQELLADLETEHLDVLYHNHVRWLSLAKVLRRVSGGCRTRFRGSRGGGRSHRGSSGASTLLDKFVKQFAPNGSLIVRSPFNVKVRGSYFDKKNNVDRLKNKRVYDEIYSELQSSEDVSISTPKVPALSEFSGDSIDSNIINKLSQTLESILPQSKSILPRITPLHVLLYGRLHHRIDSYSIVDANQKQNTHLYLTDANSFEEAESMLNQQIHSMDTSNLVPDGLFTLLTPSLHPNELLGKKLKNILDSTKLNDDEVLSSSFKVFCPKHIFDIPNSGLKSVFLIPTGEGGSHLELDSTLIHKIDSVGLHTEYGNITVRDLVCQEIRLASQMGDIMCEGNLEGHTAPSMLVTTDDGDINVLGSVNSDVSQFYTRNGHIHVKHLNNQSYMLVRESGNILVSVDEGFITAVVKTGTINVSIDQLTADSTLQVEDGEIILKVYKKRNFRINAIAQHINISPLIANQGDFSFSDESSHHQTFQIDPSAKASDHLPCPVLKVEVLQGTLNLSLIPEEEDKSTNSESERVKNT